MAYKVTVEGRRCNGCEECLEACTVGMFRMQNGKALPVEDKECLGCESCVGVCDENAITITDTRVALSNTCLSLLSALDEIYYVSTIILNSFLILSFAEEKSLMIKSLSRFIPTVLLSRGKFQTAC